MTAYELYANTLRELEHWQAPVWEPHDFNYRFNDMRQQYVDELKKEFERTQHVTDELRAVMRSAVRELNPANGATDARTCPLPSSLDANSEWEQGRYQFLVNCRVVLRFTKDRGCLRKGRKREVKALRHTGDSEIFNLDNYFARPMVDTQDANVYYKVRGNTLELTFDTENEPVDFAVIERVKLSYLAAPNPVHLNSRVKDDPAHVDSDWPPEIDARVVRLCVAAYQAKNPTARDQGAAPVD